MYKNWFHRPKQYTYADVCHVTALGHTGSDMYHAYSCICVFEYQFRQFGLKDNDRTAPNCDYLRWEHTP